MTKIKICGLFRQRDIDFVNEAMPDYIGFVFAESRRQVTIEEAAKLRLKLKDGIIPVGVFVNAQVEDIAWLFRNGVIDYAQLHGNEDSGYISRLRNLSDVPIIKAVRMDGRPSARGCDTMDVDCLLLDNGAGGSGKSFDWGLIPNMGKPFFLAGGIHAGNIRLAIETVQPYAVDLSSGVETDGVKNRQKILEAVRRVRYE